MLAGRKDARGNIINDGSIKNWFLAQAAQNSQPGPKPALKHSDVLLADKQKPSSNRPTAKGGTSFVCKGSPDLALASGKENLEPTQKLTKTELRRVASRIKQRAGEAEPYRHYSKGYRGRQSNFLRENRWFKAEAQRLGSSRSGDKKRFDTIIKSNESMKSASDVAPNQSCVVKHNGQTELSFSRKVGTSTQRGSVAISLDDEPAEF